MKRKTLGGRILSALAQHVVSESPELQTLIRAAGYTSETSRRREDPEPSFGPLIRKRRKKEGVRRGRAPEPDAAPAEAEVGENGEPVIELEKKSDGSYGPR